MAATDLVARATMRDTMRGTRGHQSEPAPDPALKVAFLRHLNGVTRHQPPTYDTPLDPRLVAWCEERLQHWASRDSFTPLSEDRRIAGFAQLARRLDNLIADNPGSD